MVNKQLTLKAISKQTADSNSKQTAEAVATEKTTIRINNLKTT